MISFIIKLYILFYVNLRISYSWLVMWPSSGHILLKSYYFLVRMSKVSELTSPKLKGARHQEELLLISPLAAKTSQSTHPGDLDTARNLHTEA